MGRFALGFLLACLLWGGGDSFVQASSPSGASSLREAPYFKGSRASAVAPDSLVAPDARVAPDSLELRARAEEALARAVSFWGNPGGPGREMAARQRFLETLDELAAEIPGDRFIFRHRVGTLLLLERFDEAGRILDSCAVTPWWCHAMGAYRAVLMKDWDSAHEEHRAMTAVKPHGLRCLWLLDLHPLLDGEEARRFEAADCEARAAMAETFWWLADPLHTESPNRRELEHHGRLVAMNLHHDEMAQLGMICTANHHAEVMVGGWPPRLWALRSDGRGHSEPAVRFAPPSGTLSTPLEITTAGWSTRRPSSRDPRARLGTGPLEELSQLQVAFFPRPGGGTTPDSVVAHVALAVSGGGAASESPGWAGVSFSSSPYDRQTVRHSLDLADGFRTDPTGPAWIDAGWEEVVLRSATRLGEGRHLVSAEVFLPGTGFHRARFGHGLSDSPGGLILSDPVVFDWDPDIAEEASNVLPLMRPGPQIRASGPPAGIFWEVHGLHSEESFQVTLAVSEVEPGRLRRMARALGISSRPSDARLSWNEVAPNEGGMVGRSVQPDLSELPTGSYDLVVTVETSAGRTASSTRRIRWSADL